MQAEPGRSHPAPVRNNQNDHPERGQDDSPSRTRLPPPGRPAAVAGLLWALAAAGKASVAVIIAISVAGGVVQIIDSPARQVRDGLRYAASRQQLWLPLVMMALVGLLAFNFPVILPVLASSTFHGSGGTYGLLTTMLSIGSVAGSLGVGFIRHPRRPYLMVAALAFGVFLAATAGAPDVAVACIALAATGVAAFSFVTLCSTALQLHSSTDYRGRIMALWVYVYLGTTPVGSIITGAITSAAGPRVALLTGAAACLVAAAIASRVHTPPHANAALTDLTSA